MCFALSLGHVKNLSALPKQGCGSPLSRKFPTVALQWSKSSASGHGGGCIETHGTCAFNIHSIHNCCSLIALGCEIISC